MAKAKTIELSAIKTKSAEVTIYGQTDLVLNKMNAPTTRALINARKDKQKGTEAVNEWECVITSMHWMNGGPSEFTEEALKEALNNDAPCISAYGLKKSLGEAVKRTHIEKYSTDFLASVNIIATNNLVPIKFAEHHIDEKLMSPKKGSPVLVRLNRFVGWSATFTISWIENAYSLEQLLEVIMNAGFGLGIGSGRSSGYGRYSILGVKEI